MGRTKGKGQAFDWKKAVVEFNPNAECTKDADCPSSYCQNGFCHGCFDKCCETDNDCKKKGMATARMTKPRCPLTSATPKATAATRHRVKFHILTHIIVSILRR